MHPIIRLLLSLSLIAAALPGWAQDVPPPPLPPAGWQVPERAMRELSPEERTQWRESREQRREARRQMSPEERHAFRRDIRNAGRELYPHGQRHGR
jgi:hypothetical protein